MFQVGVDLFDDRVTTVRFVRGDSVHAVDRGSGEEGVEPPAVEQAVLVGAMVEVGDAADDQPTGDVVGFPFRGERGERDLGYLSPGDPLLRFLVEDGVGVVDGLGVSDGLCEWWVLTKEFHCEHDR